LLAEERKNKIIQMLKTDGIVKIDQLADVFNVSIYTIRRDLTDLEKKGLLKKTHGGAIRIEKSMWLPTPEEGLKEAAEQKKSIAHLAASHIEDGDTVFLMGSTITHMMIPHISNKEITVVTNSLDVAKSLSSFDSIDTILIGGKVKNYKGNILGSRAIGDVSNYHFDKSFIPCGGIHHKWGITTSTIDSADFIKAVINSTRENILVADYRKIGRVTFAKICNVNCVKILITDSKADKNEIQEIAKAQIIVEIAKELEYN